MNDLERIDDRDSSVAYSKPLLGRDWFVHGGPREYLSTSSLTRKGGASAKITFSGSSIAVYGTVSGHHADSGTTSSYSIDGGTGTTYTTAPDREPQYGVKFFESGSLSPGQHTLEVVNQSEGGWFWLDYFDVSLRSNTTTSLASSSTLPPTPTPTSTSTTTTSSTPSSTSSSPLATFTSTDIVPVPTTSSNASNVSNSSTTPSPGVLVGAILGGMFGLALLVLVIWLFRRKLADKYADEAAAIPTDMATTSKTTQGFNPTHKSNESRNMVRYEIFSTPDKASNMAQMHYDRQGQRSPQHQEHSQYGSANSDPNFYSFSPVVGGTQQAYYPNDFNGQRGPLFYPAMQQPPQHHHQLQQAYGHYPGMAYPPRVGSPSYPGTVGAYGASGVIPTGAKSEHPDCSPRGPSMGEPSRDSPPAYSGLPPGLPGPGAQ